MQLILDWNLVTQHRNFLEKTTKIRKQSLKTLIYNQDGQCEGIN